MEKPWRVRISSEPVFSLKCACVGSGLIVSMNYIEVEPTADLEIGRTQAVLLKSLRVSIDYATFEVEKVAIDQEGVSGVSICGICNEPIHGDRV